MTAWFETAKYGNSDILTVPCNESRVTINITSHVTSRHVTSALAHIPQRQTRRAQDGPLWWVKTLCPRAGRSCSLWLFSNAMDVVFFLRARPRYFNDIWWDRAGGLTGGRAGGLTAGGRTGRRADRRTGGRTGCMKVLRLVMTIVTRSCYWRASQCCRRQPVYNALNNINILGNLTSKPVINIADINSLRAFLSYAVVNTKRAVKTIRQHVIHTVLRRWFDLVVDDLIAVLNTNKQSTNNTMSGG